MTGETPPGDRMPDRPPVRLEILPARNGAATLKADGRSVHSGFDPLAEAGTLVASLADAPALLLFGYGLGYAAAAWHARFPERPILAFDHLVPDRQLDQTRAAIDTPPTPLLHTIDAERIRAFLRGFSTDQLARLARLHTRGVVNLAPLFYREAETACDRALADELADRFTELEFDRLWLRNLLLNTATLPAGRPFSSLHNAFHGQTALLVGAGPSLTAERDWIAQERERFILFAVDTALRPLVAAGIEPDFVVSLDGQIHNLADFHGIDVRRMRLLYDLSVYPAIPALPFRERFHFETAGFTTLEGRPCLISHPCVLWIKQCIGEIGALSCGGNVTTSAIGAIRSCGFTTLLLCGCDHAFPGGATHCRDAPLPERLALRANRIRPLEAQGRALVRRRRRVRAVANDGSTLTGDLVLERYAAWTEAACRNEAGRMRWLSLSARARRITGIEYLPPAEASRLLRGSSPATATVAPAIGKPGGLLDLEKRLALLRRALAAFLATADQAPDGDQAAAGAAALFADFPFLRRAFRKQELFIERKQLAPEEGARFLMREMRFFCGRVLTLLQRRIRIRHACRTTVPANGSPPPLNPA